MFPFAQSIPVNPTSFHGFLRTIPIEFLNILIKEVTNCLGQFETLHKVKRDGLND